MLKESEDSTVTLRDHNGFRYHTSHNAYKGNLLVSFLLRKIFIIGTCYHISSKILFITNKLPLYILCDVVKLPLYILW